MAKQVQLRRGSASDHTTFTGAVGELTYVSDDKTLRIHDGATARGVPVGSGILSARSRGAVGDGATDDTVALQAVIDAATGAVDLEGLTYLITATLILKSGLILQNGTITYPTMTNDAALEATGSEGSDLAITGNVAFDATTLSLSSGDAATLAEYDMIFITDTQTWNANQAAGTYTQGEIAQVKGVSGTTVTLRNPTAGQYTTAKTAVVRKITPVQDVRLENLVLLGNTTVDTSTNHQEGVVCAWCSNITITGCRLNLMHTRGISLERCMFAHVSDCTITNTERSGYAYGIAVSRGSSYVTINGCTVENARHATASGGSEGVNRYITVSNCTATGMHDACFDNHAMCDFTVFSGNSGTGQDWGTDENIDGIVHQGGSCVISNNIFHGVSRSGILCQNGVAEGMKVSDIQYTITGNTLTHIAGASAPADGGSGISITSGDGGSGVVDTMTLGGVTISGNSISDANDAGIYVTSKTPKVTNGTIKNIAITGNSITNQYSTAAYAGIRIYEQTSAVLKYGTIVGNVIEMDATTSGSRCIELTGTPEGFAISANTTIKGDYAVHLNSAVDVSVTGNVFLETGTTSDYVNSTSATGTIVEANNLQS